VGRASAIPPTLWVPITVASASAAISLMWLAWWLMALTLVPMDLPAGVEVLPLSGGEVALTVLRRVGGPLVAVGTLVLTWRLAWKGESAGCRAAAFATVCITVASIIWW
jgi:hypothetical protein